MVRPQAPDRRVWLGSGSVSEGRADLHHVRPEEAGGEDREASGVRQ